MSEDTFNEKLLTEKLSKLNSSQQSIESLSQWCISHRKKAKQVVEDWEKLFKSARSEQRVSFLYLANDILQNSRRKGSEFVNEFWKVLPAALKSVYDSGDEHCRKVAFRLVDIWEERKVFGSRGQNLKNEMLGKNPAPAPAPASSGRNSNPIKVVKRDANSLRLKLAVGGMPEKILTAFQLVFDENVNEDTALNKCKSAVSHVQEIEKDVENLLAQGNWQGSDAVDKINEQEKELQECVSQLEKAEAIRVGLVSQLKEALQDQESNLQLIRNELLVARSRIEQATSMKQRLTSPNFSIPSSLKPLETSTMVEPTSSPQPLNSPPPPAHSLTLFATSNISEEEKKKAAIAAVAAKLAASSSSAQMLTSVFSSFVAQEAASMGSGSTPSDLSSFLLPPEKRPKLEHPVSMSDMNSLEGGPNSGYFSATQQGMTNMPPLTTQSISQPNQMQGSFPAPPPPPPPANSQLVQPAMMGMPYGYGANNLLQPPMSSNMGMGSARPGPPPQQAQPQQMQNQQPQLQQPATGGYYRPSGFGFYGPGHQSSAPPVPRQ